MILPPILLVRLLVMQLTLRAHAAVQAMFPNADDAFWSRIRVGWDARQNCPSVTLA